MTERPTKITFAEMRDSGVRGLLIYYTDCHDCDQRRLRPTSCGLIEPRGLFAGSVYLTR